MTLQNSNQKISPTQIFGVEDLLAKMSQLPEEEKDYQETEVVSFLNSLNSSRAKKKRINPHTLSPRMLKDFYQVLEDSTLQNISIAYPKQGTMQDGRFLIPKITECHRTENGYSLLQILEVEVDEKYYLSVEKTQQLLSKL